MLKIIKTKKQADVMKKTTNTSKNPMPEWLLGGNPNAIERQEKQGQDELIASMQLPITCNSPRGINATEQYTKMGIKIFTRSKGDDLFVGVKLPEGWKKEATDHSMWNNLLDNKGRERASFFYKAAFYDRSSFINFNTRYITKTNFHKNSTDIHYEVFDRSTKTVLFKTELLSRPEPMNNDYWAQSDALQKQAQEWLNNSYPNHEDINAYWD